MDDVLDDALVDAKQLAHENRLENKDLDELAELEDEEDDEFLQMYRNKRMQEWKDQMSKAKFGSVYPISKPEYTAEVTDASKEVFVVVHMFQDSYVCSSFVCIFNGSILTHYNSRLPACKLLAAILERLAPMYPQIKFVKIPGKQAVENYPEAMMPTLLIYGHGDLQQQILTLATLGGMNTSVVDVAEALVRAGALKDSDIAALKDPQNAEDELGKRDSSVNDDLDDDFD